MLLTRNARGGSTASFPRLSPPGGVAYATPSWGRPARKRDSALTIAHALASLNPNHSVIPLRVAAPSNKIVRPLRPQPQCVLAPSPGEHQRSEPLLPPRRLTGRHRSSATRGAHARREESGLDLTGSGGKWRWPGSVNCQSPRSILDHPLQKTHDFPHISSCRSGVLDWKNYGPSGIEHEIQRSDLRDGCPGRSLDGGYIRVRDRFRRVGPNQDDPERRYRDPLALRLMVRFRTRRSRFLPDGGESRVTVPPHH